jgi:hypothetical protein
MRVYIYMCVCMCVCVCVCTGECVRVCVCVSVSRVCNASDTCENLYACAQVLLYRCMFVV